MKHLKILVQVPFATSKVVLDIQYKKHCIRVASRVAERRKIQDLRKLGNIGSITKMVRDRAQYLVFLTQIKVWYQWSKIMQKQISKFFCPVQFCLISSHRFINFVCDCRFDPSRSLPCRPQALQAQIISLKGERILYINQKNIKNAIQ